VNVAHAAGNKENERETFFSNTFVSYLATRPQMMTWRYCLVIWRVFFVSCCVRNAGSGRVNARTLLEDGGLAAWKLGTAQKLLPLNFFGLFSPAIRLTRRPWQPSAGQLSPAQGFRIDFFWTRGDAGGDGSSFL